MFDSLDELDHFQLSKESFLLFQCEPKVQQEKGNEQKNGGKWERFIFPTFICVLRF